VRETIALRTGLVKGLSPWYLTGPSGIMGLARSGQRPTGRLENLELLPVLAPTATASKPHKEMGTFASAPRGTKAIPTSLAGAQVR